jgi:hypothetical protein
VSEVSAAVQPEPRRIKTFVHFFKEYMSVSSVIAASLPIPVTTLQFIPTYSAQTKFLSVYTSLSCFLLLGFIFYSRHTLARWMFRPMSKRRSKFSSFINLLPVCLIVACGCFIGAYHWLLQNSIQESLADWVRRGVAIGSTPDVLLKTDYMDIPGALGLVICYLGIFLTAEAAFVLMATREYLQDLLQLSEEELITVRRTMSETRQS